MVHSPKLKTMIIFLYTGYVLAHLELSKLVGQVKVERSGSVGRALDWRLKGC